MGIAGSAGRRLLNDGTLAVQFPAVILRQQLDGVLASRWADGHVPVSVLWEDMARYVYLPRLRDQDVLLVEIEVRNPAGFDSDVIRNVNENTRELDFEEGTGFTSS